jgi:hypothetical protein
MGAPLFFCARVSFFFFQAISLAVLANFVREKHKNCTSARCPVLGYSLVPPGPRDWQIFLAGRRL